TYLPQLPRQTAARCSTALRRPPAPLQLRPRDACGFLLHAAKDFRQCRTTPALDCAPSFFPSLRPCARLPPRCVRLFDCQAALRPTMHPHFHTPVRCIPNPASPVFRQCKASPYGRFCSTDSPPPALHFLSSTLQQLQAHS